MRYTKKELYELLPAIYRQHDAEIGKPLEALIGVIAEQVEILENDIENLYDNLFIETCEEWVVPYIGDLVGAKLLRSVENATISQRAWVANTISYRRRKGTAAVLEQIAHDVTGWNAKAVEFFQLLDTTQYINHLRPTNTRTPDLRNIERLELLDTPFDTIPHTVDVRNIRSGRGYHNIPNIGLFLWRLQAYPVINAPAYDHDKGRYSFSQLGYDIPLPLFNHPVTETGITNLAEEINVPTPIRRLALKNNLKDYYGSGKSMLIEVDGSTLNPDDIIVCNLSGWKHRPLAGKVAIDPVLGRIAFPINKKPESVHVTYYYGFNADMGGGFYDREELDFDLPNDTKTYQISKDTTKTGVFTSIPEAITYWGDHGRPPAIFEILDSEFYEESFDLTLNEKDIVVIRSAQNQRAVLRTKPDTDSNEPLKVTGHEGSRLILEGLLIDQRFEIGSGDLYSLSISHCTLVPRENPSLMLDDGNNNLVVTLHRSISGKIVMTGSEAKLKVIDSIVDQKAVEAQDNNSDNAIECYKVSVETSTIFGKVKVNLLELASNTIFTDIITAERRQEGCVRFSYIPQGLQVPRRYRCQPDHSSGSSTGGVTTKVQLRFTSERYGDPGYAQLHRDVAKEIFEGADTEAEMGAFNHLYQPQRISNLGASLDEYLRFGLEAGIFLVT